MNKLFGYLKSSLVTLIPSSKGIIIPSEDSHKVSVVEINALCPEKFECRALPLQDGKTAKSLFIGLKLVRDTDKMISNALDKLESLDK